jgi:uncharacterized tellurite resistance protein B-like protein
MGLFSNILGGSSTPSKLNEQESLIAILLSAVAADGNISDEEVADFNSTASKAKLLQNLNGQQFKSVIDRLFVILRREGVDHLLTLGAEGLPQQYYQAAFTVVCDLLFSDGRIEVEEERLLEKFKEKLNINSDTALNIVNVIAIKNSL